MVFIFMVNNKNFLNLAWWFLEIVKVSAAIIDSEKNYLSLNVVEAFNCMGGESIRPVS